MTTTNPRPLVVWDNYTTCHQCGKELHVLTDGLTLTVTNTPPSDHLAPERWRTYVTFSCPAITNSTPSYEGDRCGAFVMVDVATEGWTPDAPSIAALVADPSNPVNVVGSDA